MNAPCKTFFYYYYYYYYYIPIGHFGPNVPLRSFFDHVLNNLLLVITYCICIYKVHELIATAISDMAQGYFSLPEAGELSSLNVTSFIPTTMAQWKDAIYLSHGSLLSQVNDVYILIRLKMRHFVSY